MRETMFRGRRGDGSWIYGVPIKCWFYGGEQTRILIDGEIFGGDVDEFFSDCRVDPETVGQYTGLKDKNGVEIYEGDIISSSYLSLAHMVVNFEATIDVAFCSYGFAVDKQWIHLGDFRRTIEVIGNIYKESNNGVQKVLSALQRW